MKICHRNSIAFTLIELLITGVALSFLFVIAFVGAKHLAAKHRELSCIATMRSLGVAIHLYRADQGNYLPPNRVDNPGVVLSNVWNAAILPYLRADGGLQPDEEGMRAFYSCAESAYSRAPDLAWRWWHSDYGVNGAPTAFGIDGSRVRYTVRLASETMMLTETASLLRSVRPSRSTMDYRHRGLIHVLFFDGHLKSMAGLPSNAYDPFWTGQPLP